MQEYLNPEAKLTMVENINILKIMKRTIVKYENYLCVECCKKGKIKTQFRQLF